jgi:hypothetical protein
MVKNKKAQEEMIGFALIIVIMAVVILVLFSLTSRHKQDFVESYEADNFVQAMLQYTTNCSVSYDSNILDIRKLVKSCNSQEVCLNNKPACEVLNQTLAEIMEQSWNIGPAWHYKGYEMAINSSNHEQIFYSFNGNKTNNFKGANQDFETYFVDLKIYF